MELGGGVQSLVINTFSGQHPKSSWFCQEKEHFLSPLHWLLSNFHCDAGAFPPKHETFCPGGPIRWGSLKCIHMERRSIPDPCWMQKWVAAVVAAAELLLWGNAHFYKSSLNHFNKLPCSCKHFSCFPSQGPFWSQIFIKHSSILGLTPDPSIFRFQRRNGNYRAKEPPLAPGDMIPMAYENNLSKPCLWEAVWPWANAHE